MQEVEHLRRLRCATAVTMGEDGLRVDKLQDGARAGRLSAREGPYLAHTRRSIQKESQSYLPISGTVA
jgi:hypothetical protein